MNETPEIRICLKCGIKHPASNLVDHEYRCPDCNLETAHLDRAPNGLIRGIYSWLRQRDDVVHERYRVKSLLGRGGFAATYLVDDLRLDGKTRALKEIPELLFDTYETNLLSRLDHPSIPDITDQFTEDGLIYLVLKFAGNRTLESVRKKNAGRIPLDKLIPWMKELCDVLAYLHSQEPPIIHRDLKPANILLDESDRVTLIDFGIAKIAADGLETRTLARAVTHGFSPPEQVGGTGTDARSDIYSLAATFYSVATGIVPPASHERLAGKSIVEPTQLIDDFPPALNDAIMQALDLNLNNRQSTIEEFGTAFENVGDLSAVARPTGTVFVSEDQMRSTGSTLKSSPIHSVKLTVDRAMPGAPKAYKSPLPLVIGTVAAIAIVSGVGFWYWQNHDNNSETSKSSQQKVDDGKPEAGMVAQPDGNKANNQQKSPSSFSTTPQTTYSPAPTQTAPPTASKASDIFDQYRKQPVEPKETKKIITSSATSQQRSAPKPRVAYKPRKPTVKPKPIVKSQPKQKSGLSGLDFGETYR